MAATEEESMSEPAVRVVGLRDALDDLKRTTAAFLAGSATFEALFDAVCREEYLRGRASIGAVPAELDAECSRAVADALSAMRP